MLPGNERRKYLRLLADTEASVLRKKNGEETVVQLVNLSPAGCAFTTRTRIEMGEILEITITSPSDRIDPLICEGEVVRADRDTSGYGIGVEFTDEPT